MAIENLWHGSDRPHQKLLHGGDGGIHVGTQAQAVMRNPAFLHRVSALIDPCRLTRSRDTGGHWASKVRRARLRGADAIVYLNRWEGVPMNRAAADLDALSDKAFRSAVPEAEDSLIILDESSVIVRDILPGAGRLTLYHGTTRENAEALLSHGFDPSGWRRGANCGRTGMLYLTDDPMNAQWFGEQFGDGVVLEFRPRACDLVVDPEDGVEETVVKELMSALPAFLATRKPISPHHIKLHTQDPTTGLDLSL